VLLKYFNQIFHQVKVSMQEVWYISIIILTIYRLISVNLSIIQLVMEDQFL